MAVTTAFLLTALRDRCIYVDDLREMCRALDLSPTGPGAALVERIALQGLSLDEIMRRSHLRADAWRDIATDVCEERPAGVGYSDIAATIASWGRREVATASYDEADEADDLYEDDDDDDDDDEAPALGAVGGEEWRRSIYLETSRGAALPRGLSPALPLKVHQERALASLVEWWGKRSRRRGILCLPTGAGKTRTAISFALRHLLPRKRVLWLTHRDELVDQAIEGFLRTAPAEAKGRLTIGRYQAGHRKIEHATDVVVAMIPTLAVRRNHRFVNLNDLRKTLQGDFGLVIVDECHHAAARSWFRLLEKELSEVDILGLTATPQRANTDDERRMWSVFGRTMIHEERVEDLIKAEVLSGVVMETVDTHVNVLANEKERRAFEHFAREQLPEDLVARVVDNTERSRLIAERWARDAKTWGQTLVFAATTRQADELAQLIGKYAPAACLKGTDGPEHRRSVIEDFRAGKIRVLTNCMVFSEGTDLPAVRSVFVARPTRSPVLFRQMVGRGMRGPAMGGTPLCNVVAFYDHIEGLATETMASCFENRRLALEALGLPEPSPPDDASRPTSRTVTVVDSTTTALHQAAAMLRNFEMEHGGWPALGNILSGWYFAEGPDNNGVRRRSVLPVFRDDAGALDRWVADLRSQIARGAKSWTFDVGLPPLRWISREHFRAFTALAMLPMGRVEFHALEAPTAEWTEVAVAIETALLANAQPPVIADVPMFPGAAPIGPPPAPPIAGEPTPVNLLRTARLKIAGLDGNTAAQPTLDDVLRELRPLTGEERREAAQDLYRAFFKAQGRTFEDYLLDLAVR